MPIFGCATEEQFYDESDFVKNYHFKPENIKKMDLIKIRCKQADDMESFLKSKGLYQEYYDKYIAPEIVVNINFDNIRSCFNADKSK